MLSRLNKLNINEIHHLFFLNEQESATSVVYFPGEHEDEGDNGEGAQSEAPSTGIPQSPEGKAALLLSLLMIISKRIKAPYQLLWATSVVYSFC